MQWKPCNSQYNAVLSGFSHLWLILTHVHICTKCFMNVHILCPSAALVCIQFPLRLSHRHEHQNINEAQGALETEAFPQMIELLSFCSIKCHPSLFFPVSFTNYQQTAATSFTVINLLNHEPKKMATAILAQSVQQQSKIVW